MKKIRQNFSWLVLLGCAAACVSCVTILRRDDPDFAAINSLLSAEYAPPKSTGLITNVTVRTRGDSARVTYTVIESVPLRMEAELQRTDNAWRIESTRRKPDWLTRIIARQPNAQQSPEQVRSRAAADGAP